MESEWHKWTYLWDKTMLTNLEKRPVVAKGEVGEGEEVTGGLRLADANYSVNV